jgi:hypothetical protein
VSLEVDIKESVKALIFAAGLAVNVAQADITHAASDLSKKYRETSARQIEAEIARHIRNKG